jgi:hypothetical protein
MRARSLILLITALATALLVAPTGAAAAEKPPFVPPAAPITCPGRVDLVATSSSGGAISYTWICPAVPSGGAWVWFEVCDSRPDGHHAEGQYTNFNTALHRFEFGPTVKAVHGYTSCAMVAPFIQIPSGIPVGSEYDGLAATYEGHNPVDDTGISAPYTVGG